MKKMIFSALAIALCSAFVACDKIDNGCKCSTKFENGDSERRTYKNELVKEYNVNSCSAFAKEIKVQNNKYANEAADKIKSISCHSAK